MKFFSLFIQGSYSAELAIGVAVAAFVLGFIFKSGVILKQRKRILHLEDEMLANHARILSLEKRVSESRRTNGHASAEYDLLPVKSASTVN